MRKPWEGLRDAPISKRAKIDTLIRLACKHSGFCGGPGLAGETIALLRSIDAKEFALAVLRADGFADAAVYETEWFPYFEHMFRDVFGDGDVDLDDEPT